MNVFEDPTPIYMAGGVIEIALAFLYVRTGRPIFVLVMAGVLLATVLGVVVERVVVTDRERLEQTIDEAAMAVVSNDYDRLASFIAPDATHLQQLARWGFSQAEFSQVRITDQQITIDRAADPLTAQAKIFGVFYFKHRSGQWPYDKYPANGTIFFRLENDRWLATDYEMDNDPLRE
ncbi:MAG: hypothetical protein ACOY3P_14490 [Planctomycetota bacterium]